MVEASINKQQENYGLYEFQRTTIGPRHAKTCPRAYADIEGPDQPAHLRSLIRAFAVR